MTVTHLQAPWSPFGAFPLIFFPNQVPRGIPVNDGVALGVTVIGAATAANTQDVSDVRACIGLTKTTWRAVRVHNGHLVRPETCRTREQ